MKVRFLGTAAFEGIPALFCRCSLCLKAREHGGKDIRTRTSVLLDDDLKIDFPPDTLHHMHRDNLDLEQVQDLLLTHSHSDHLYAEDLAARLPGYAQSESHTIRLYGNGNVIAGCKQSLDREGGARDKFELIEVKPFERIEMRTAIAVALPAAHDPAEDCLLYCIEKDGKSVLYGHDSGLFPEETWQWLKSARIDLAILECTMGHAEYHKTHMNIDAVLHTRERLLEYGTISADGRIVVTHFSHNAGLTHDDLVRTFAPYNIETAFDGMTIEI